MASSSSSSSSSKVGLFQLLIIFCCFYRFQVHAASSFGRTLPDIGLLKSCNIDKIYQFGASKADTGNGKIENPSGSSNFPPYGQSFLNKQATGRASDGKLMIDYIASAAGIPFLHPYLNSHASFIHGANFAVGGSTALPIKENANVSGSRSSLGVQVNWMTHLFVPNCNSHNNCSPRGPKKALFIVGEAGNNDYTSALFDGKTVEQIKSDLMPRIVQSIMSAVQKVISVGAMRIIVPGQFPLGCFPVYLTVFQTNSITAYDEHKCLKALNDLSVAHNDYLQHAISKLQAHHPSIKIVYGDYYNAFKWLLNHAHYIGVDAKSTLKVCCGMGGTYNFNPHKQCGSGVPVCLDPARLLNWDGTHLTQKANRFLATWLVADFLPKFDC